MSRKLITTICVTVMAAVLGSHSAVADEGMWMINGINKALEKKMKQRGLKLSAGEIYNADAPGATLSDAIVALDFGCTGSIISDEGLLITNHHCAYSDVHSISTDEKNYLEDGFWAMSREEERPIPGKNVFFLKKVLDVTEEVHVIMAEHQKQGRPCGMRKLSFQMEKKYSEETGYEAWLSSMWSGEKYYIMLYEVFSDIRLVAAPPVSISAFGGDIDNWEWPQQKCDFAMYRVYASADGKPAAYSAQNVPLKGAAKLQISTQGYKEGDYAMVIGFPGRTNRYSSSAEVSFEERVSLPISNTIRGKQMEIINKWMNSDPSIRLLYSDNYFSLSNVQELNAGKEKNVRRFGVVDTKIAQEEEMQKWIDADPERQAKWGSLIPDLKEKFAAVENVEKNITLYRETMVRGTTFSRVISRINTLKRDVLAKRGVKRRTILDKRGPDSTEIACCCHYKFCGNAFKAVNENLLKEYDKFNLEVERDLFNYSVRTYLENVDKEFLGEYHTYLLGRFTSESGKVDYTGLCNFLWDNSFLTDKARLENFVSEEHTINEYCADPMFCFYQDVNIRDFNTKAEEIEGSPNIAALKKEYTHALYEMSLEQGLAQYPNANSTMRITYGTVGDIKPFDAMTCSWHSTSDGILEKYNPSSYEYNLDPKQKKLLEQRDWGRWAAKDKKDGSKMFVNFLTDNDITGGNSGSPVMNAKGEIIGLAFDGNKESLASDVEFVEGYTKCVCVDIRYVLWVLDRYAGMNHILSEIGL